MVGIAIAALSVLTPIAIADHCDTGVAHIDGGGCPLPSPLAFPAASGIGMSTTSPGPLLFYQVGVPISNTIFPEASGGTPPYAYAIDGVPNGLEFDATNRVLSGTPAAPTAKFNVNYTVTDSATPTPTTVSLATSFDICYLGGHPNGAVACGTPATYTTLALTSPSNQTYTANAQITELTLPVATGGTTGGTTQRPTSIYSLTSIPAGLSFNGATRVLSGVPTTAGTTQVSYKVRDAGSPDSVGRSAMTTFTITVSADSAPEFQTSRIRAKSVTVGTEANIILPAATGGDGDLVYSIRPRLPAGLSFDANTHTITGTPTAPTIGVTTRRFFYNVEDSDDSAIGSDSDTRSFRISVQRAPATGIRLAIVDEYGNVITKLQEGTSPRIRAQIKTFSPLSGFAEDQDVTFTVSTPANGQVGYTGQPDPFRIDAQSALENSALFTLTITDDELVTEDTIVTYTATAQPSGVTATAQITLQDDDAIRVITTPQKLSVPEAGTAIYTVRLNKRPPATTQIAIESQALGTATVSNTRINFTSNSWNQPHTITVNGVSLGATTIRHTTTINGITHTSSDMAVVVTPPFTFQYTGTFGSTGTGANQFASPLGITVNDEHIFVADTSNRRIQIFDIMDNSFVSGFGSFGSADGQFDNPSDIAVNATNIFVADRDNNRVQVFDITNNAHVGKFGSTGTGNGQFRTTRKITLNDTHIFVVDSTNNRVQVFDINTYAYVGKFGGLGSGDGQLNAPRGIAVNDTHIFVADTENDRVQVFNIDTYAYVGKFGSLGSGDGQLNSPLGIAINDTYIFVADSNNNRIQIFNIDTYAYVGKFGTMGAGNGEFQLSSGVATNGAQVFVTEINNSRVQIFEVPTTPVFTNAAMFATTITAAENQKAVGAANYFVGTTTGGGNVVYDLSGTDAALFEISSTGTLTFVAAPDFENPRSQPISSTNTNVYSLNVVVIGVVGAMSEGITVMVTDVEELPTGFTITAVPTTVTESTTPTEIEFTATLTDGTFSQNRIVRVLSLTTGIATVGDDYTAVTATDITILANTTSKTVTIPFVAKVDTDDEPDGETVIFRATLLNATGDAPQDGFTPVDTTITINDDDTLSYDFTQNGSVTQSDGLVFYLLASGVSVAATSIVVEREGNSNIRNAPATALNALKAAIDNNDTKYDFTQNGSVTQSDGLVFYLLASGVSVAATSIVVEREGNSNIRNAPATALNALKAAIEN